MFFQHIAALTRQHPPPTNAQQANSPAQSSTPYQLRGCKHNNPMRLFRPCPSNSPRSSPTTPVHRRGTGHTPAPTSTHPNKASDRTAFTPHRPSLPATSTSPPPRPLPAAHELFPFPHDHRSGDDTAAHPAPNNPILLPRISFHTNPPKPPQNPHRTDGPSSLRQGSRSTRATTRVPPTA